MTKMRLDDTIVAISTPVGEGGIGIVRLSGKDSLKIADKVFVSKSRKMPSKFRTYTVNYGHIIDNGQTGKRANGQRIIDEVILTVMKAPRSYTKEDVVEINCHSGIVPLRKTLGLVLKNGARLAEPGEFTKRAFLNGRIDISQAESVLDIIRSKTDLSLKLAVNNLEGLLSKKINDIRDELIDILARIEASIDFSEEEDVFMKRKDIFNKLNKVSKVLEKLISSRDQGKILRQGINTVICGSPNVGKSSLMNALLKESRAIVTHLPGTTRDTIEEVININGIPVVLVDTAGITRTDHPVEKEGIKRSHSSIQRADLILLVLDHARKINKLDISIAKNIKDKDNVIVVVNKNDLKKRIDLERVKKLFPKKTMVYTSAINQSGIEKLEKTIEQLIFKGKAKAPDLVSVSNDRQIQSLCCSSQDTKEAMASLKNRLSMDCIAIYVRSAIENIGHVTGHTITEEALDRIFEEFCVGK